MRRPLGIALVVVGLAAVLYGTASLTGEWLGEPPWVTHPPLGWWAHSAPVKLPPVGVPFELPIPQVGELKVSEPEEDDDAPGTLGETEIDGKRVLFRMPVRPTGGYPPKPAPNRRAWVSVLLTAVGLGMVAVGAWPRRRPTVTGAA